MSANSLLYGLVFVCSTVFHQLVQTEKPDDGCGQSGLGPESGLLSFRNYPSIYPNNSWCEWKIRVSNGLRIVLKFDDLSFESDDCDKDYLKVLKDLHGTKYVYWWYCGDRNANPMLYSGGSQSLYTDSSELTVIFRSSVHSSGRGFLLSYSTVDQSELLTCSDKGSFDSLSKYRKYCPAGCGEAEGNVAGDVSQGYMHSSVLCKAAVHAGVILDQLGGPITVEENRGLMDCEAVHANGILSKCDAVSDSYFTFVTNDCKRQAVLQSVKSSWVKNAIEGPDLPPKETDTVPPTGMGSADPSRTQWLKLDLGEKKRITGILIKNSTSDSFIRRYKIVYMEKSQWRTYAPYKSFEDEIFERNMDQARSTFRPAVIARYLGVVPLQGPKEVNLTVELLGCLYVRTTPGVSASSQVTQEALPTEPKRTVEEESITEPVPSQTDLVMLAIIVVPTVLSVALLLLGICLCKVLHKKKTKENTYDCSDPSQTGCWKQVKPPSARHQSTEFTFLDPLPKIDLVTSDMADYQQPLMLGVGTVSRKGSTFRPMDTDAKDEVNEAATHYDYVHTANQYALPLTNQEPEYATPIIDRHAFHKDSFLPDPSYSVPGVVLSKKPSFKTKDISNCRRVVEGLSGGYQTPQVKPERVNHSEGIYDSPKIRKPMLVQNGTFSEYQRPQAKTMVQESYSTPRDCVWLGVPSRLDPEGSSLGGTKTD